MPDLCQLSQSCFAPAQALDVTLQEQQPAIQHLVTEMANLQSMSSRATLYIEQHLAYVICLIKTCGLTSPTESRLLEQLAGLCIAETLPMLARVPAAGVDTVHGASKLA